MPTLSHAESWRLYSWWWDSHISPKNSKWLQEDLTDMDIRVKNMIKLIEEDGDSFAMRAEMYYKRRPELIKLVEEFYRAYRALAERYGHATRGLQQAHDTMTKELHNRPCVSLNSQHAFVSAEFEPHSPRILLQTHNLFDPSDQLKEHSDHSSHCHTPRANGIYSEEFDILRGKKGLKQVSEMFASSVGSELSLFSVKSKNNADIIQEELTKRSEFEPHDKPEVSKVENKDHLEKLNKFQVDDDSCNKQNQNFQFNPSVEFSAQSQEGEEISPHKYREYMLQLKEDNDHLHETVEYMRKEAVELKLVLHDEHLRVLRAEAALESLKKLHTQSQEKLEIISSKRQKGIQMLEDREMEIQILEGNLQQAKREFIRKTEEIDELRISFEEECVTLEKLQLQCESDMNLLVLEIQRRSHQCEEAKSRKEDLEETVRALELMINNLHDEISHMEKAHLELEDKLRECTVEKEALQLENIRLQEKVNDLELKQVDAIHQMNALTIELQSLQVTVEILQDENLFMKDVCSNREEENHLLFDSLKDANSQLDELKKDIEVLDGSITSLRKLNSNLEAENSMLRYQKDAIQCDARKILEENVILESSLSDVNLCTVEMEGKIRCLEDTCQSLFEEKFVMENERHVLMLQVDCTAQTLKSWEKEYMELHDKNLSLEAEKDSTICRESELEILLNFKKQEKEIVLHSSNAQIAALKDRICHLDAEVESTQVELLNKDFEAFVFQSCLFDQRVKNIIPIDKQEKLEHEVNEQRGAIEVLSDHVGNLKEQIFSIGRTIGVNGFDHKVITERLNKLCNDSLVMEDENHILIIEKSVGEIFLRQFAHNALDLIASIDNHMKEILGDKENQKSREEVDNLQNRKTDISSMEDEENSGLLSEFEILMADSHHAVVCGMIFEEKVLEMTRAYEDFKLMKEKENLVVSVEMASRTAYDKEHCRKCGIMEEEVKELKAELNRCQKLVSSINDKVPYFEDCIRISTKHQDLKEEPDVKCEFSNPRSPGNVADELQKLMDKLDVIQRDVIETKVHGMVSTFISKSSRETIGHTKMPKFEKEIRVICTKDHQTRRDGTENSNYIDEIILKDIQLDSISSISREKGYISPYENGKSTYDTKELEMNIVQVPKKGMNSHRDWSDVIQRLSVDAQRLASLQTGVLDVKRKLESIERSNYPKESECHTAKEQLKQVENSVVQLIGTNHKLIKRANNGSSSSVYNGIKEREDVCNQQKRGSRKIGRWELELQKAQCTLLEIEEGVERQRNRAASRGSRVVLSDYLFGRAERKKTQQFCGCVETKDNCHLRRRPM